MPMNARPRMPRFIWNECFVDKPACSKKYVGWLANGAPASTVHAHATHAISVRRRFAPLKQSCKVSKHLSQKAATDEIADARVVLLLVFVGADHHGDNFCRGQVLRLSRQPFNGALRLLEAAAADEEPRALGCERDEEE